MNQFNRLSNYEAVKRMDFFSIELRYKNATITSEVLHNDCFIKSQFYRHQTEYRRILSLKVAYKQNEIYLSSP